MEGIELLAVAAIEPGMPGDHRPPIGDLHHPGVGAQQQPLARVARRHAVAIALEGDQRLSRGAHGDGAATRERMPLQRQEHGALFLPQHPDRGVTPGDGAGILGGAPLGEQRVERLPRGHIGDRHEEVAPRVADETFDQRLLVRALEPRQAEVAREEIVAPEGDERLLLDPAPALQHLADRRAEVVVDDPVRHAPEGGERIDMSGEEALLPRRREGADEGLERVAEPETEELGDLLDARDAHDRLAPVALRLLSRRVGEREEGPCAGRVGLLPGRARIAG